MKSGATLSAQSTTADVTRLPASALVKGLSREEIATGAGRNTTDSPMGQMDVKPAIATREVSHSREFSTREVGLPRILG